MDTSTAEGLHHLVVARVLDEHHRCKIGPARRIDVGAAINTVIVENDDADRQLVAADRLDLHAGEAECRIALQCENGFAGFDRSTNREAHPDAHDTPGADVETL